MRHLLKTLFVLLSSSVAFGQGLFEDSTPLETSIRVSIQEVKKNTSDSSYTMESLHFKNSEGKMDSILISIRGRGNFRYQECYYPPLKINIKKKQEINKFTIHFHKVFDGEAFEEFLLFIIVVEVLVVIEEIVFKRSVRELVKKKKRKIKKNNNI